MTFKSNPYTWDTSASDIKSVVLDFELKDENGHRINIYNLEQEVELFLSPPNQNVEKVKEYFVKPSNNGTMQFHKLEFPGAEYAISIRIVPIGCFLGTIHPFSLGWFVDNTYTGFQYKNKKLNRGQLFWPAACMLINKVSDGACQGIFHDVVISIGGIIF